MLANLRLTRMVLVSPTLTPASTVRASQDLRMPPGPGNSRELNRRARSKSSASQPRLRLADLKSTHVESHYPCR
jgi:hypothetical protein